MKKAIIIVLVIGVLAVIGFLGFQRFQKASEELVATYQTEVISKGELTAVIGATGTVRANQTAVVYWQTSGKVGHVFTSIDEDINAEMVLADLSRDSLSQSIILAEADLISAQKNLEELQNSEVAQAQAQLALAQAQDALENAEYKRASKEYQRASNATLDSARASYILAQDAVDNAQSFYNQYSYFPENDVNRASALSQLSTAIQTRDRALAQLNWLLGMPDSIEIAEADANLAVAEANLLEAQREWERLKDGPDPDDIRAAEVRIEAIEQAMSLVEIKAPFTGTVTEVNSKIGDLVSAGTAAFRIDDFSRLLVDVEVPEVDINRILPGQIVKLTFDAISDLEYTGQVIEVARVGTTSSSGVDFTVTIELLDADENVLPGMTAAVNIVVNQLYDVLLVPNRAVRLRDGIRVVFILENNTLRQVAIEIGASADTYSQIISGEIKEGDVIVLNPPSVSLLDQEPPFAR